MKFVPKGPINNIPALAQIMAWRRPGDKRGWEGSYHMLRHVALAFYLKNKPTKQNKNKKTGTPKT